MNTDFLNYDSEDEVPKKTLRGKETREEIRDEEYSVLMGWNQLFLKDDLKRSIRECGFEHPSEIQIKAIPHALQGHDLLVQAKSGMGKTAVFVISILNQITPLHGKYKTGEALIICNTRELAHQIYKDFKRLGKYFKKPDIKAECFYGGIPLEENLNILRSTSQSPHIIIGTPGRLFQLIRKNFLSLSNLKYFVIDECDKVLNNIQMRGNIQDIFIKTPLEKQVMMLSATLSEEIKGTCKKFMNDPVEILINSDKLTLRGLTQYYTYVEEDGKFEKLVHVLDTLPFNQAIIFVNRVERAKKLTDLLKKRLFNPICIHSSLSQEDRIMNYDLFKANCSRLLVATDLFGRGIDIQRVNLVMNYDFPWQTDDYLHRVGRAGRFGTKGLAISFITNKTQSQKISDKEVFEKVQAKFRIKIKQMPKEIDIQALI